MLIKKRWFSIKNKNQCLNDIFKSVLFISIDNKRIATDKMTLQEIYDKTIKIKIRYDEKLKEFITNKKCSNFIEFECGNYCHKCYLSKIENEIILFTCNTKYFENQIEAENGQGKNLLQSYSIGNGKKI